MRMSLRNELLRSWRIWILGSALLHAFAICSSRWTSQTPWRTSSSSWPKMLRVCESSQRVRTMRWSSSMHLRMNRYVRSGLCKIERVFFLLTVLLGCFHSNTGAEPGSSHSFHRSDRSSVCQSIRTGTRDWKRTRHPVEEFQYESRQGRELWSRQGRTRLSGSELSGRSRNKEVSCSLLEWSCKNICLGD